MARCSGEPMMIVRREYYEDDEFYYEKDYTNYGATIINSHPKHPEKPKEDVLAEVAPLLYNAWLKLQRKQ